MKTSLRQLILSLAMTLCSVGAFAQNKITIKLQDASNGDPVGFATVSLTVPGRSSAYKYVLTDDKGAGTFEGVRRGTYQVKAELLGYKPYTQTIEFDARQDLDLGTIKMEVDAEALEAAQVTDIGNPVIIKKDTIEYNADAFKTSENDMLEDLLKKLPGVEIDDNGTISVNGKTITEITVGDKTFFLNDPTVATKNLPAKMIKKLKVIRKKSEQAEFTGVDDGEERNVLDLTVQDGMMNAWVGNLTAAGGHDIPEKGVYNDTDHKWQDEGWRFSENSMLMHFTQNNRFTFNTSANNANNMRFNGARGGFGGGFSGFGGGSGGGGGAGITTSWSARVDGGANLFDDKMDLTANYGYNGAKNENKRESYTINYLADGSQIANTSENTSHSNNTGNSIGLRIEHRFSPNTIIQFDPQVNFGTNHNSSTSNQMRENVRDGVSTLASKGFTIGSSDTKQVSTSGRLQLRQRLGIPGRTMTATINYSYSNSDTDGFNQSLTTSVFGDVQKDSIINQRYVQNSKNLTLGGNVTYTEPLGNNFYVEGNYQYNFNRSVSFKDTYNSGFNPDPFIGGKDQYSRNGEYFDPTYSNEIINRSIRQTAGANLLYQDQRWNAQVGISVIPTNTYNSTTRNGEEKTYDNKVLNFAPRVIVRFNQNDNTNWNIRYNGQSSQPSVNQLMPVPDNSNPLNVSFGNPYLKPYFTHNGSLDFRHSNTANYSSLNLTLNGGMTTAPISNTTWYGTNSGQYSYPVNAPASFNGSVRYTYNTPLDKSRYFTLSSTGNFGYNQSSNYVEKERGSIDMTKYYTSGEFDYELFHKDYSDLGKSDKFITNKLQSINFSEQIRVVYRNDYLELGLRAQTSARKSFYTVSTGASTNMTWNNRATLDWNWTPLGGWEIEGDYSYVWYNGYTTTQKPENLLNATITKNLGIFSISLMGYDLLNQAKTLNISESGNYYSESRTSMLGRYVMLSVSVRFNSFAGRNGRGAGGMMRMGGGRGGFGGGGRGR